jgi:hypothetical protein
MGGSGKGPGPLKWWAGLQQSRNEAISPPKELQTPSMSDEAIRNAILSERSRALTGNSRKAAFAVRGKSTSYLGE